MWRRMFSDTSLRRSPSTAPSSSRICTEVVDFFFRQIADFLVRIDACAMQQALRPGPPDAVNVSEADLSPLFRW